MLIFKNIFFKYPRINPKELFSICINKKTNHLSIETHNLLFILLIKYYFCKKLERG